MSFLYVSPVLKPILAAATVSAALLLLLPPNAQQKGSLLVGDGTKIAVQSAGLNGQAVVYDSTSTTGLASAPLNSYQQFQLVGSDGAGGYQMSNSDVKILVDNICQRVTLPDGNVSNHDIQIKVPLTCAFSPNISGIQGIDGNPGLVLSPGDCLNLSFCSAKNQWIAN